MMDFKNLFDIRIYNYFLNHERLADFLNAILFDGQMIMDTQDIIILDSNSSGVLLSNGQTIKRTRFQNKDNRDLIIGLKILYAKKKVPEKFIISHELACLLGTLIHDERIYQLIEKKKGATNMSDYVLGIRKKGRNEGIITTLIKLLTQKFGNLSKDTIKAIKRSNKKQLNSLTLHIFDIEKEEDIKKILLGK